MEAGQRARRRRPDSVRGLRRRGDGRWRRGCDGTRWRWGRGTRAGCLVRGELWFGHHADTRLRKLRTRTFISSCFVSFKMWIPSTSFELSECLKDLQKKVECRGWSNNFCSGCVPIPKCTCHGECCIFALGRYFWKILYLQVKIWNSPRFPVWMWYTWIYWKQGMECV